MRRRPGHRRVGALHIGRRMLVWQTSIFGPDGMRVALVTQTQLVLPAEALNE